MSETMESLNAANKVLAREIIQLGNQIATAKKVVALAREVVAHSNGISDLAIMVQMYDGHFPESDKTGTCRWELGGAEELRAEKFWKPGCGASFHPDESYFKDFYHPKFCQFCGKPVETD